MDYENLQIRCKLQQFSKKTKDARPTKRSKMITKIIYKNSVAVDTNKTQPYAYRIMVHII